ncbi:MAG: DUF4900 domain-containing protein [bacterium]|nr:DUF4900 domain-containing protein [bacterium]
MLHLLRHQRGMALMAVLTVIFILSLLGALILYLSGKEMGLSSLRVIGAQSMYIAEGGAFSGRAALMALMGADPIGQATVDPSLDNATLSPWYADGDPASQNALRIFDFLILDGLRFTFNATSATESLTFHVNWNLPQPHRKLQPAAGMPPSNPLGEGNYAATVTVRRRLAPHPYDSSQPLRYVHRVISPAGSDEYQFFYTYEIVSDGRVSPQARRRIALRGDYSIHLQKQNFAQYALFSHVHLGPDGASLWFADMSSYDGPVHTNTEFRFAYFPKFGTPDSQIPCDESRARTTRITSAWTTAWFFNRGSPVRRTANENVVGGQRRDAPVIPDCDSNSSNDHDNLPANFTRGVAAIPIPTNPFSQKGVSLGRHPEDTSEVTPDYVRARIPELKNTTGAVPTGIYVPVTDADGNCRSDADEPLLGGVYVQGDLSSLTLSVTGGGSLAAYTLVQGTRTVTITVDRANNRTTVTDTNWPTPPSGGICPSPGAPSGSATRVFSGVPKGWQGLGSVNAGIIYVEGAILSLQGTLEEKEQTTIVASGRIDITGHIRYEVPPAVHDPNSNPINLLGIYSPTNDIRFVTDPNDPNTRDLDIHAVLMAGNLADGFNSRVFNANWNATPPRGVIRLIGGLIEEYLGVFGVMNTAGQLIRGYGSDFKYDRRMSRGFSPPYFPTTNLYQVQALDLAGVRPVWREGSP